MSESLWLGGRSVKSVSGGTSVEIPGGATTERRKAFISYSREADGDLAPDIKRSLQRLSNPWYQRRAFIDVTLDTASFGASHDLDETIYQTLDGVDHLVLLLSAGSATSPWTAKEAAHWIKSKGPEKITYVVTEWDGDLNDFQWAGADVPEPLRAINEGRVPLAVDLRWAKNTSQRTLDNEEWASAMAQIAADVKDVEKDQLVGELVALRTRARLLTGSILLGLLILLIAIGVSVPSWWVARQAAAAAEADRITAEDARDEAEAARGLAESARNEAETARLAAVEAEAEAVRQADEALRLADEAEAAQRLADQLRIAAEANLADAEAATLVAQQAQATADRLKAAAETARDVAQVAQARAETLADEAEAAAAAADRAAFGSRLDAAALENLEDDPQLSMMLAVAGFCQSNECETDSSLVASQTSATAVDLDSIRTLLLVAQASRGVERHLTADNAVAAAISADGSTVVVAIRPAAGSDRIERFVDGKRAGSLVLDSWSQGFDHEIEALALSDDGVQVAVVAWPAGGQAPGALFGSADMSDGADKDIGSAVDLKGARHEYPKVQLDFQPGSRRHLLLQAHRIDLVGGLPANVHVLLDLETVAAEALGQYLDNGPAAFTSSGSLLTAAPDPTTEQDPPEDRRWCVVERTVPALERLGGDCNLYEEPMLLGRATIGTGSQAVDYSITATRTSLWIDQAAFGTGTGIRGQEAASLDIIESAGEIRIGFVDGTVQRWSFNASSLGPLEGGRAPTTGDHEVVFGPTGASIRHLSGDPLGGWASIGSGSAAGSIQGGFAVIGGQVRTEAGRRLATDCLRCDVAVSDRGGSIVFANGTISTPTQKITTVADVPDGFYVVVAASANGDFVAFAQPSIQIIPPTQESIVLVVDLRTDQRWTHEGFATDYQDVTLLGLTDQGAAIFTIDNRELFVFDAAAGSTRLIVDSGPATSILDGAVVGQSVWILDSNGVITEYGLDGSDRSGEVRLERVGFSSARSLAVLADGSLIAVGLANGTVELWEQGGRAAVARGLADIDQPVDHVDVKLTSSGLAVMSIGDDRSRANVVALQRLDRDVLLSSLCSAANRRLTSSEWQSLGGSGVPLGC